MEKIFFLSLMLILLIFHAKSTTTTQTVPGSEVLYTALEYVDGCSSYQKTVETDEISGAQTVTYECLACFEIFGDEEIQLFLGVVADGRKGCFKKAFQSEGCQQYAIADYVQRQQFETDDIVRTRNGYKRANTCTKCPSEGYRTIYKNAIDYADVLISKEDIQSFGLEFAREAFLTNLTNIQYCMPESSFANGCINFTGTAQIYSYSNGAIVWISQDLLYPDTIVCNQCAFGFILQSGCTLCNTQTGLRKSNKPGFTCIQAVNNCLSYDAQDVCQSCKTGFKLANGQCQFCDTGFRKSDLNASNCIAQVVGCNLYENDVCKSCVQGKIFSQLTQTCVEQGIENCKNYQSSTGKCLKCKEKYVLQGGKCVKKNTRNEDSTKSKGQSESSGSSAN